LKNGIFLINNVINFTNILDKAEYQYYIKILNSMNKLFILRRCLIKDATASFFQNLMRVLGAKDEYSKKIANLDSSTH
jgi:hypothetical protein